MLLAWSDKARLAKTQHCPCGILVETGGILPETGGTIGHMFPGMMDLLRMSREKKKVTIIHSPSISIPIFQGHHKFTAMFIRQHKLSQLF